MFIVFDLDGTLALNEHRQHFVRKDDKSTEDWHPNWKAFFEACDKDEPNWHILAILYALEKRGHKIEIWSGRSAEVYDKTMTWLGKYDLQHLCIRMREEGDYTPDEQLKKKWLDEATTAGMKPDLVFDDRDKVVKMWRENGIVCCQVAEGSF